VTTEVFPVGFVFLMLITAGFHAEAAGGFERSVGGVTTTGGSGVTGGVLSLEQENEAVQQSKSVKTLSVFFIIDRFKFWSYTKIRLKKQGSDLVVFRSKSIIKIFQSILSRKKLDRQYMRIVLVVFLLQPIRLLYDKELIVGLF
jgi:hypothetical protein